MDGMITEWLCSLKRAAVSAPAAAIIDGYIVAIPGGPTLSGNSWPNLRLAARRLSSTACPAFPVFL